MTDFPFISSALHPLSLEGEVVLPRQFTYPFCYKPHPLSLRASHMLQECLRSHCEWQEEIRLGKMFGVLVVMTPNGISSLWAFSGLLDGKRCIEGFVPPVYDVDQWETTYREEDSIISAMPDVEEKSERSRALQMKLFNQFQFLNARGETRSLVDIFDKQTCRIPPSGAGECCAPKLLQYAYRQKLQPLCMAEFWLGRSPKGEVRYEGEYYPACQAKCKPILEHMIIGLDVEENPLIATMREKAREMKVIYEDDAIIAVYKPAGMLAVRGNVDAPSVESVIQATHPYISGPLIVHRLDMDTSGIMMLAKDKETHKALQIEFYRHEVRKRYIAILEGTVESESGTITLPLSPNKLDRPRQMVNYAHGKEAVTHYEVLERKDNRTRIVFYPQTGRTHQLRVHAAHSDGLGCPIVGDRLYSKSSTLKKQICTESSTQKEDLFIESGTPNEQPDSQLSLSHRMYLHAESIDFIHPATGKHIHLEVQPDF